MQALSTLKLYAEENAVLEALLQQNLWRQGKRARWYERRALLHTNYLCRSLDPEEKKKDFSLLLRAMEGIKEALNDEDTHLSRSATVTCSIILITAPLPSLSS